MQGALAGKSILVTGSSRGIGAAICAAAASEGARVGVHYGRFEEGARETLERVRSAGGDGQLFQANVADGEAAERLVNEAIAHFGALDGLVNNAGMTQVSAFLTLETSVWDAVIATDLSAAFHTCRAVLPSMVERGSGSIVNIASRLGQMGIAETAAYSAAKAGLIGLAHRSLAREFGPKGVRINAVAPGVVETPMTADLVNSEEGKRRMRDMALGRFGRPEEVAQAVVFLLSDRASLFTGQTLNPNAGGYMP